MDGKAKNCLILLHYSIIGLVVRDLTNDSKAKKQVYQV
jgi:hypothetical protein